jgi:hypothetical protein
VYLFEERDMRNIKLCVLYCSSQVVVTDHFFELIFENVSVSVFFFEELEEEGGKNVKKM